MHGCLRVFTSANVLSPLHTRIAGYSLSSMLVDIIGTHRA